MTQFKPALMTSTSGVNLRMMRLSEEPEASRVVPIFLLLGEGGRGNHEDRTAYPSSPNPSC